MEIETAPRPPAQTPWGRLALLVVLLGPVIVLVLLPIGLGLERYVMTGDSMAGSMGRGTIAFERAVPVNNLRVGDVITYRRPGAAVDGVDGGDVDGGDGGVMITHRIVSIRPDAIRTQGDAVDSVDPWVLRPEAPTISRVEFTVPWIGWAYLLLFHTQGWVLTLASAAVLALLTVRRLRHPPATIRQHEPTDVEGVASRTGSREATP